ncbi:MAG: hypothetical protein HQK52_09670 [Oligoflexia bacterium]|nr:hypothetical protein [Oligoflexia bacterium]
MKDKKNDKKLTINEVEDCTQNKRIQDKFNKIFPSEVSNKRKEADHEVINNEEDEKMTKIFNIQVLQKDLLHESKIMRDLSFDGINSKKQESHIEKAPSQVTPKKRVDKFSKDALNDTQDNIKTKAYEITTTDDANATMIVAPPVTSPLLDHATVVVSPPGFENATVVVPAPPDTSESAMPEQKIAEESDMPGLELFLEEEEEGAGEEIEIVHGGGSTHQQEKAPQTGIDIELANKTVSTSLQLLRKKRSLESDSEKAEMSLEDVEVSSSALEALDLPLPPDLLAQERERESERESESEVLVEDLLRADDGTTSTSSEVAPSLETMESMEVSFSSSNPFQAEESLEESSKTVASIVDMAADKQAISTTPTTSAVSAVSAVSAADVATAATTATVAIKGPLGPSDGSGFTATILPSSYINSLPANSEHLQYYTDELVKLQTTIRGLRDDREVLLQKIQHLEEEKLKLSQRLFHLESLTDELKIDLAISQKHHQEQLSSLQVKLKTIEQRSKILEEKNRQYVEEILKLNQRVRIDISSVKEREKVLENQLELLRADTENQIATRDQKILELKRQIDTLEFNMESASLREEESKKQRIYLQDKLDKIRKNLAITTSCLEEDDQLLMQNKLLKKINI